MMPQLLEENNQKLGSLSEDSAKVDLRQNVLAPTVTRALNLFRVKVEVPLEEVVHLIAGQMSGREFEGLASQRAGRAVGAAPLVVEAGRVDVSAVKATRCLTTGHL